MASHPRRGGAGAARGDPGSGSAGSGEAGERRGSGGLSRPGLRGRGNGVCRARAREPAGKASGRGAGPAGGTGTAAPPLLSTISTSGHVGPGSEPPQSLRSAGIIHSSALLHRHRAPRGGTGRVCSSRALGFNPFCFSEERRPGTPGVGSACERPVQAEGKQKYSQSKRLQ